MADKKGPIEIRKSENEMSVKLFFLNIGLKSNPINIKTKIIKSSIAIFLVVILLSIEIRLLNYIRLNTKSIVFCVDIPVQL